MTPRPTVKYLGVTSKPRGFTVLGHHRTRTRHPQAKVNFSPSSPPDLPGPVGLGSAGSHTRTRRCVRGMGVGPAPPQSRPRPDNSRRTPNGRV